MDIGSFRQARASTRDSRKMRASPAKRTRAWDDLREAAAPEHVPRDIGQWLFDRIECVCGWKSPGYYDGMEFAWDDWREHVAGEMGLDERACPCGKKFVPADGGRACHELRPTQAEATTA